MPKTAILIDGGYFLKRLPSVRHDIDRSDSEAVARAIAQLVRGHLNQLNQTHCVPNMFQLLYRTFYYDALPYANKLHTPIDKRAIDYAKSDTAIFRRNLFDALRKQPNLALRLGQVKKPSRSSWVMKQGTQNAS